MNMQQESEERFLLFEDQIRQSSDQNLPPLHSRIDHCFWSDCIVLVKDENNDDNKFWKFNAVDLLMNESRSIQFRKTEAVGYRFYRADIYPLSNDFGIIVEMSIGVQYVNLVKLDWDKSEFELIDHFQVQAGFLWILVDKMHPSKFVMIWNQGGFTFKICKLVNGMLQRDNLFQSQTEYVFYTNDKLFHFKHRGFEITINDLVSSQQQTLRIDESHLPQEVQFHGIREWVNDRLFMAIKFQGTANKFGIVWTNLMAKRWALFDFKTNLRIRKLQFSGDSLIVVTKVKNNQNKIMDFTTKIYSIPMIRPNHLRHSAWLLVVQFMKKRGEKNPIEAASEYLPLNSDLRSPWFKDEEPIEELFKKLSI